MNLEEQVKEYEEIRIKLDELEERRKALSISIMQEMQNNTLHLSDYVVRRYSRLSIKLSLESARALDAIITQETVDKDKIKLLYQNGQSVDGVSEVSYIRVFKSAQTIKPLQRKKTEADTVNT